jgi:hypothetical protein
MRRLEKAYRKFNGTLSVPLNIIEVGGGIHQALTLVEFSLEYLKAQESLTYPK